MVCLSLWPKTLCLYLGYFPVTGIKNLKKHRVLVLFACTIFNYGLKTFFSCCILCTQIFFTVKQSSWYLQIHYPLKKYWAVWKHCKKFSFFRDLWKCCTNLVDVFSEEATISVIFHIMFICSIIPIGLLLKLNTMLLYSFKVEIYSSGICTIF